jgi:DNA-binding IclR family transcriptional regulator
MRNDRVQQVREGVMRKRTGATRANDRGGTQSIERAISLLREISARGDFGWQLSDLAARCHLGKSTTHRVLAFLVRERLVRQRPNDRHYMPGPLLFELGLSVPGLSELQHKARIRLAALAKRSGGVAFLFFHSGDDFVCAVRVGNAELKAFSGFPGSRKPLITSVGGVAILLALPAADARQIVSRNLRKLTGYTRGRIREIRIMLERSRTEGLAVNAGNLLPGVNSYAMALLDTDGQPFASIALAAAERVLPVNRISEIRGWLEDAAKELQEAALEGSQQSDLHVVQA